MIDVRTTKPGRVAPIGVSRAPTSPLAMWVGQVTEAVLDDPSTPAELILEGGEGYSRARCLVRAHDGQPRGFVEVPVVDAAVALHDLQRAVHMALPPVRTEGPHPVEAAPPRHETAHPTLSIIVCTYDRPQSLRCTLDSLLPLGPETLELVVVDNHPQSGLVAGVLREVSDPRVRLVSAPERGLARARNAGVRAARGEILAFTDDDTLVDEHWARRLVDGFARSDDVACVTGLVPSAELSSPAQLFFDARVAWARSCEREIFRLADRGDDRLFPFRVARFGTGANFALRAEVIRALGGFDERLGAGSPAGGGEDIDIFVRVLLSGHALAYEPGAIVWHRHREDLSALESQLQDYGRGLGAWMSALVVQRVARGLMIRRALPGVLHLRHITRGTPAPGVPVQTSKRLGRAELRAFLTGPAALLRGAAAGAQARPLTRGSAVRVRTVGAGTGER